MKEVECCKYLCNVMDVLANLGDVVRPFKQPLAVKFPPSISPRLLYLLPHPLIGTLPRVQHAASIGRLLLDLGKSVSGS